MLNLLLLVEKVALVGGLLHTMVPGSAPVRGTLLLDRGLIEAVGPDVKVPADARTIDLSGRHVVPGLIDGLVNFDPDHDRLYLSCGVTLVREQGADLTQMLAERDTYARDRNPGPSLWIAGAVLDGAPPSTRSAVVMSTRDEAVDKASRLLHPTEGVAGIDYFSTHLGLPSEAWLALIEVAHKEQPLRQVWGPLPRGRTLEEALQAGQDGIFHLDALLPAGRSWNDVTDDELVAIARRLGQSRTAVTPTLAAYAARLVNPADDAPELKYLGPIQLAQWLANREQRRAVFARAPEKVAEGAAALQKQVRLVRALYDNGVELVPGSAAGATPWLLPGEALLHELSLWTGSAGIPGPAALALATQRSAARIGALARYGTLEAGKVASLVVTAEDPAADLRVLRRPELVVVRGRVLAKSDLEALRDNLAARQRQLQALAFQPLQLQPPTAPPGEPVLSGTVETRFVNQRVSGERFAVSRSSDGALHYAARLLTFGSASTADTECEVLQKVQGGRLVEFSLTVTSGPRVVSLKGVLAGGTLNVEQRLNDVFQKSIHVRESVPFLELGSVVSDLILGQHVRPGPFRALYLQDFELAVCEWALQVDPATGQHVVNSAQGARLVDFAPDGAPQRSVRESGSGELLRTLVADEPGGAGLPVPAKQNPGPSPK